MEKRLLFGMAGVVLAVLFAFLAQALTDARGCAIGPCDPVAGAIQAKAVQATAIQGRARG